MKKNRYRVIHWGTGNTGQRALRQQIGHPHIELVGLYVHSADKVGKTAAELCGLNESNGVLASNDLNALLALDADCFVYMATEWGRTPEAVYADICRILAAGKNVVTTTYVPLIYAKALGSQVTDQIEAACRQGNSSFYATGIEPGFTADALVLQLSSLSERIRFVHVHEHMNVDTYAEPVQAEGYGFGITPEADAGRQVAGWLSQYWSGTLHMLADGLGVTLEAIREKREVECTPVDIQLPWITIKAGTIAAIYFEVTGFVNGEPRLCVSHSYVLDDTVGARWSPPMLPGRSQRRNTALRIEGDPDIRVELSIGSHDAALPGVIATAARVVNAIPAVCDAPAGIRTFFDLPPITGCATLR
jgi:4-hydroxy-tetrahydrodipicolinate reductase